MYPQRTQLYDLDKQPLLSHSNEKDSNPNLFMMEIPSRSGFFKYLEVMSFDYSHLGPGS